MARTPELILLLVTLATWSAPGAAQTVDPRRFDGTWDVTLACPQHTDGALAYTFRFPAQVEGGVLRGQHGTPGSASSLSLQGTIQPNGQARLAANGLTGERAYNADRVEPALKYAYTVQARFDGGSGSGNRVEGRTCRLDFIRR